MPSKSTAALVLVFPERHRHRALLCCPAQCAVAPARGADTPDNSLFWNQGMHMLITTIATGATNSGFSTQ